LVSGKNLSRIQGQKGTGSRSATLPVRICVKQTSAVIQKCVSIKRGFLLERLVDRVASSTLLADRRDACRGLKAMSKKFRSDPSPQCWGSVAFWCGSADPYLCLMDPDLTPDPTTFFSDFKDAKKKFSSYFVS
jgi:hypothetical protein